MRPPPDERDGGGVRKKEVMSAEAVDEGVLVQRARARDREAFGTLVSRYRGALERILISIMGDRERARDLVQDTALRAYSHLHRYRSGHRFSTWFFRIGINLALSAKRRERLEGRVRSELRGGDGGDAQGPLDHLMQEEEREQLRRAVAGLPDRYREVLRLRYGEEMPCKEIAARMETTANTVSIVLFRAKQRLREELRKG